MTDTLVPPAENLNAEAEFSGASPGAESVKQTFVGDWIDDVAEERGLGPISVEERENWLANRPGLAVPAARLLIDQIDVGPRHRRLGKIEDLADSIRELGLLNPITVAQTESGRWRLIAGLHRLAAWRSLGHTSIPATIVTLDDVDCQLAEIDENLIRSDLTVLERGDHLAERKRLYLLKHPETKRGAAGAHAKHGSASEMISFAEDTAKKVGVTPRSVQQDVQISEKLAPDVKEAIAETPLADAKADLLKLSRLDHEAQRQVVATSNPSRPREVAKAIGEARRDQAAREPKPELDPARIPPTARIEWADARALPLDRESVHLIVTSPPYSLSIDYEHGDIDPAEWRNLIYKSLVEMHRVAVPGGRLAFNIPLDSVTGGRRPLYSTAVQMAQSAGWLYRSTIVWADHELGKSTARGSVDSASSPSIIAPVEMVALFSKGEWKRESEASSDLAHEEWLAWTNGLWQFRGETKPWEDHPAAFPIGLPHRLIKLLSFPGDVVLDPFSGSGTTAVAALRLGRQAIGYDRSQAYVDSALRRIAAEGFDHADRAVPASDPGRSDADDAAGVRGGIRSEGAAEGLAGGLRGGLHCGAADAEQPELVQGGRAGLTDPFLPGTRVLVEIRGQRVCGTYLTIQANGAGPVLGVDVTTNGGDRSIGTGMHWVEREQVCLLDGSGSSTTNEDSEDEPDDDYPREADVPCPVCGDPIVIHDAAEDRRIAGLITNGNGRMALCADCEAESISHGADAWVDVDAVAGGV